jgi:preprotein translocase SecE subunit
MINKIKKSLKNLINEYRQVKWPTLKQAVNLTIFVIIVSAIITLLIVGLDALFYSFISRFIN